MSGQGSNAATIADRKTDARIGPKRPMRSETRPISGLTIASRAAVQSQRTPIATAVKPSSSSRSGARTPSVPNRSAGRTTNQMLRAIRRFCTAWTRAESGWGEVGGGACVRAAQTARPTAIRPAAPNAGRLADDRGDSPEHRAEESPDDRRGHRGPDRLSTALGGRLTDEPRESRGPGECAPEPLDEAGDIQHDDRVAGREDEGRHRDRRASRRSPSHERRTVQSRSRRASCRRVRRADRRRRGARRPPSRDRTPPGTPAAAASAPRRTSCRRRRCRRRAAGGGALRVSVRPVGLASLQEGP